MRLIITILILLLSLNSCAFFYEIDDKSHSVYKKPSKVLNNFDVSGRFFIKVDRNSYYGNFVWLKQGTHEQLNLTSPLGQTVARVIVESGDPQLLINNKTYVGDDLDDLMRNQLGFSLPLGYLSYWIQGLQVPNYNIEQKLNNGFKQFGWNVEYLDWDNVTGYPKVIQCKQVNLTIRLALVLTVESN